VLAARLSDARFFWEQDLKVPLEEQAKKLDGIVFHEKLGTVADKVGRVAKLARWLAEQGIVKVDAGQAERAARLAKADLVTGMVGEFPELQGVIGGYLAEAQGEPTTGPAAAPVGAVAAPPAAPGLWLRDLEREARALLEAGVPDVWSALTEKFEAQLIHTALDITRGRRIEAAHKLGIGRNTITRKIQELGLDD